MDYRNIAAAWRLDDTSIGIGIMDARSAAMTRTMLDDSSNEIISAGSFHFQHSLITAGLSRRIDEVLAVGIIGVGYFSSFDNSSATGANIHVGAVTIPQKKSDMQAAFAVHNLLPTTLDYSHGKSVDIPMQGTASLRIPYSEAIEIFLKFTTQDSKEKWLAGYGLRYTIIPAIGMYVSAAANDYFSLDTTYTSYIFGTGLQLGTLTIDMAIEPYIYETSDNKTYISIGFNY